MLAILGKRDITSGLKTTSLQKKIDYTLLVAGMREKLWGLAGDPFKRSFLKDSFEHGKCGYTGFARINPLRRSGRPDMVEHGGCGRDKKLKEMPYLTGTQMGRPYF